MSEDEPLAVPTITPEELDAEIAEGLKTERGNFGLLNNFGMQLPGGAYRRNFSQMGMLDDPYASTQSEFEESRRYGVSERKMRQTHREFFAEVDIAIEESGVDPVRLEELRQAYLSKTGHESWLAKEEYLGYAIPVYRQLRLKGYTDADLTL